MPKSRKYLEDLIIRHANAIRGSINLAGYYRSNDELPPKVKDRLSKMAGYFKELERMEKQDAV